MKALQNFATCTLVLLAAASANAADHLVQMKSISYEPKTVVIKAGDTVQWENISFTPHSATSDQSVAKMAAFDTGMIDPKKKSKKIEFKTAGTYRYNCTLHGKTMSGQVEVQP